MKNFVLSVLVGLVLSTWLMAASAADSKLSADTVALVNSTAIPKTELDRVVKLAVAQGQKDSPELRELAKQDLIDRQLLSQNAVKLALDKTPEAKLQFEQIKMSYLVELALKDYFTKHPVSDTDLKKEYDRQLGLLGDVSQMQQFKIRHILLGTEAQAKEMLAKCKNGESFAQLAKQYSVDKAANTEPVPEWILPSQLLPEISAVMVKLNKNEISQQPIQTTAGWHVIKIEDKRAFTPPSFEDSKNNLRMALMRRNQAEQVKALREASKIIQQ